MPEVFVGIFDAWLQDREARVVVGGQPSDAMTLRDMICQGAVWGPWLWNIFYEDARLALQVASLLEVVCEVCVQTTANFLLTLCAFSHPEYCGVPTCTLCEDLPSRAVSLPPALLLSAYCL